MNCNGLRLLFCAESKLTDAVPTPFPPRETLFLLLAMQTVLGVRPGGIDLLPISVPLQVRESGSSCLAVFSRCERSELLLNTACRECGGGHVIQRTMPAVVVVVKTPTVNHVAGFLQA